MQNRQTNPILPPLSPLLPRRTGPPTGRGEMDEARENTQPVATATDDCHRWSKHTHTHTHMVNRESANVAGSVLLPGIARHPPPAPLPLHRCAIGFASSQLFLRHYVWHGEWAFTLHLGRGLACVFYVYFFLDLVLVLFSIFLRARSLSLSLTPCFWWPIAYRGSCAYRDTNQWRLTSKQRGNVAQTCDREML